MSKHPRDCDAALIFHTSRRSRQTSDRIGHIVSIDREDRLRPGSRPRTGLRTGQTNSSLRQTGETAGPPCPSPSRRRLGSVDETRRTRPLPASLAVRAPRTRRPRAARLTLHSSCTPCERALSPLSCHAQDFFVIEYETIIRVHTRPTWRSPRLNHEVHPRSSVAGRHEASRRSVRVLSPAR